MIKKSLVALVSVFLLVGAGCGASAPSNGSTTPLPAQTGNEQPIPTPAPNPAPTPAPAPEPSAQPSVGAKTYTMADVATHKDASSCWSAINGNVYDLTPWIGQHPGGPDAILSLCGKDGSDAFNGKHGGQPRPASELAGFKIGALKK